MRGSYPKEEPGIRYSRIKRMMNEQELDAIVLYSPQWKPEVVHHASNLRLLGEDACVVLTLSGEPCLLTSQEWDIHRIREECWIEEIIVCQGDIMQKAAQIAARQGKSVGIVGAEHMTAVKYMAFEKELAGKSIKNVYAEFDEMCKVKTRWEVEIMRRCAKLADLAYMVEMDSLRPGVCEYEIIAEMERAMKEGGADENFQLIGMGRNLPSMSRAKENYLKMGDLVLTEITPVIGSITYATQLCRTVKMGEATPLEREKHGLLVTALEYALGKMKAGIRAKDVAIWQNEIIGAAGYEEYCHPPHMRSRGHNFGLGYIDLAEDNEEILKTDTVLVIHPNQMIPEIGYLACGLTVRITDDGIERLSVLSPDMYEASSASVMG